MPLVAVMTVMTLAAACAGLAKSSAPAARSAGQTTRPGDAARAPTAPTLTQPSPGPGLSAPGGASGSRVPSTSAGARASAGDPDAAGLGALSRAFLRPAPYTGVVVQADVAGDANPPPAALSRLTSVLGRETAKAVRIAARHQLAGKSSGCWTDDDIARTTSASRALHTGGSTVALYVLFLDGTSCTDSTTLGEAYGASSMLVFVDATEQAAPLTIDPALYVEAVTTHELGHILGLVNIGYQSRIAHEDLSHPHHSSDPQSVMYWKIDRGNVIQQLLNGPPQDFDQADVADLAGLRDGIY